MKTDEVIEFVKTNDIYSLFDFEDELQDEVTLVDECRDRSQFRWYSTCENIYLCEDGYVAVRGVDEIFSEYDSPKDIGVKCTATKAKRIEKITHDYVAC